MSDAIPRASVGVIGTGSYLEESSKWMCGGFVARASWQQAAGSGTAAENG